MSLYNLGKAYSSLDDYQSAIQSFQDALASFQDINHDSGEAACRYNLGKIYLSREQYQSAIESFQQSLAIFQNIGHRKVASCLYYLGKAYLCCEQYQPAIRFFQQSLVIFRRIRNHSRLASCLYYMGKAYLEVDHYQPAIDSLQKSLVISRKIGNSYGEAAVLNSLGKVYLALDQYPKAIEAFQQSLMISRKLSDASKTASALSNLGNVYSFLGQAQLGIQRYQESLTIFRDTNNQAGEANALGNLGNAYFLLQHYQQAIEFYQQSLAIAQKTGFRSGIANSLHNLGNAYFCQQRYKQAVEFYQQSLTIARESGSRSGEARSLNSLGNSYDAIAQYNLAIECHQQSLAIIQEIGLRCQEAMFLNNLGVTLFKAGNLTDAQTHLVTSLEIYESLRVGLNHPDQVSMVETQRSPYQTLQRVLIAQNKPHEALEIAERGRARVFVELLATRLSTQSDVHPSITPPTSQHIQQIAKEQNATVVEYSLIRFRNDDQSRLYIWVIQPTGKIAFRQVDITSLDLPLKDLIPHTRQSIGVRNRGQTQTFIPGDLVRLNSDAADYQPWEVVAVNSQSNTLIIRQPSWEEGIIIERPISDVVDKATDNRAYYSHLQQLHQLLIAPIANLLPTNPKSRVIFIPHQELFLVPFPALQDASGKYLIEKHTILTAPAIQVLDLTHKQRQRVGKGDVLVVGNPTMPQIPLIPGDRPLPLASLPHAQREAEAIAQLFNTQALTGNQARKTTVVENMANARIIHLATHGILDEIWGLGSAIALAPSTNDNGLLTADEILTMNLNAELVVLSACNTGQGRITGDGVIGLSRSLISAGVPSVIVSLWTVPDASTASLMQEFYQNLQNNPDQAQALRQAMLTTMGKHPHPRDWAAFTLIGEAEYGNNQS